VKVYLVLGTADTSYSYTEWPVAVATSYDRADELADKYAKQERFDRKHITIEECEVDTLLEIPVR
jgi:hypothetical protein